MNKKSYKIGSNPSPKSPKPEFNTGGSKEKYYWLSFNKLNKFKASIIYDMVSTEHPFIVIKKINKEEAGEYSYSLVNYKEITKEEYELFNSQLE